jgi:hypothetical protein
VSPDGPDGPSSLDRLDEALNATSPGRTERRTSVEFFEVPVQTVTSHQGELPLRFESSSLLEALHGQPDGIDRQEPSAPSISESRAVWGGGKVSVDQLARRDRALLGRGAGIGRRPSLVLCDLAYFVNLKRAMRGLPSPRSRFSVLHEFAYVLGDFQLNW